MAQKFLVFMDKQMNYSIHLAVVNYHKDIEVPEDTVARCGGGLWYFDYDTETLRLYDLSGDFGKYDKEGAQKAFDTKRVFYFGEDCFEEFDFKKLILD